MRVMKRNQRTLYYANPTGTTAPVLDEWGNDTGDRSETFGTITEIKLNVSSAVGQEAIEVFGSDTSYTRTMIADADCPIVERARIWFGASTTGKHNYVVRRVADSLNYKYYALSEV